MFKHAQYFYDCDQIKTLVFTLNFIVSYFLNAILMK